MADTKALTHDHRATYRECGYLVVLQLVPESFLDGVQRFLEGQVEARIAEWQAGSLLSDSYADIEFTSRYYLAWLAAGRPRGLRTTHDEPFALDALVGYVTLDWLETLASEVLGASRVVALDSSVYRAKFPNDANTGVPWHQDVQCLTVQSGMENFVTAWIPLVDVAEDNSCLAVASIGAERKMFDSIWTEDSDYVHMRKTDAAELRGIHTISVHRGDLVLLSPHIPHCSLDNAGSQIRWSIDLRYAPA
jgi:hypothetical protein